MNNAPVVLFAYNRPGHTSALLKSIDACYLAQNSDLFVFIDGCKNHENEKACRDVRKLVDEYAVHSRFKKCDVIKAESNKGLAKSVISGVSRIIEQYGRVIVLEDDLIVSRDFLQYMNEALDRFEGDTRIWSISGYSFPMKSTGNKKGVFFAPRGCSWGWATWKDRWTLVDWDVSDYSQFRRSHADRISFAKGGGDLPYMLDDQMAGLIDSWAIRWCYASERNNMVTVYPCKTKVCNCGLDGTGTHSGTSKKFDTKLAEDTDTNFDDCADAKKVAAEFSAKYGNYYLIWLKRTVKALLRRIA